MARTPKTPLDVPLKWAELESLLDMNAIREATREPAPAEPTGLMFLDSDDDDAYKMVLRALKQWAARDVFTMEFLGTERHFNYENLAHGYIDLTFRIKRAYKSYTPAMIGAKVIADWKSTKGALDEVWVARQENSWQWKLYTAAEATDIMIYRGIHRTDGMREVQFVVPELKDLNEVVKHQWEGYREVLALHNSRTSPNHPSWNRHMPYACGAYGNACPYLVDCKEQRAPFVIIPADVLAKPISYSSGERLALCPERHRRYILDREGLGPRGVVEDLDESEETRLGSAMHRGLEEAYKQLMQLQQEGRI